MFGKLLRREWSNCDNLCIYFIYTIYILFSLPFICTFSTFLIITTNKSTVPKNMLFELQHKFSSSQENNNSQKYCHLKFHSQDLHDFVPSTDKHASWGVKWLNFLHTIRKPCYLYDYYESERYIYGEYLPNEDPRQKYIKWYFLSFWTL